MKQEIWKYRCIRKRILQFRNDFTPVQCALEHTEIFAHFFFHPTIMHPWGYLWYPEKQKCSRKLDFVCYQNWKYFQLVQLLIRSVWNTFWAQLPVCRKTDEKETFVCLPSSIILTLPTLFRLLFAEIFIQSSILFQNLLVQTENLPSF